METMTELTPLECSLLEAQAVDALRTVFDPEIPVNIYEMGLIYDIAALPSGLLDVRMTLTSPGCPAAQSLPAEAEQKLRSIDKVTDVRLAVVWEPTWTLDMMSDEAKLELGLL